MNVMTRRANNLLKSKTVSKGNSELLVLRIYRYPETGEYIIGAEDANGKTTRGPENAGCADSLRATGQMGELFHQWDKLAAHG
jgi:hypothetical protein